MPRKQFASPVYNNGNTIVSTQEEVKRFGNFIHQLRVEGLGIEKRTDAAKKMKVSYGSLTCLELGYARVTYVNYIAYNVYYMPTRKMLRKIARAYKDAITYEELCVRAGYPIPVKRAKK